MLGPFPQFCDTQEVKFRPADRASTIKEVKMMVIIRIWKDFSNMKKVKRFICRKKKKKKKTEETGEEEEPSWKDKENSNCYD